MAITDFSSRGRDGIARRIADLRQHYAAARQRRAIFLRTRDELHALTDRDLADLGFHRSEIGRIARRAANRV